MIEKAFAGNRRYWTWIALLLACIAAGVLMYMRQLDEGLAVTGLSRTVSWGLYIGQFTFFDGIAASALMVVIPYYLHDAKQFGKVAILGVLLAIAGVIVSMLFVMVDLGQPSRVMNVLLYPAPHSVMFWDILSLSGYLLLNAVIAFFTLGAERQSLPPPAWLKAVVYLSIPWAVGIQIVSAFLYSGLAARPLWLTAVLVPRFLASAFAAGTALLILMIFVLRRTVRYDVGEDVIGKLSSIVMYAASLSALLVLGEIFTGSYGGVPADREIVLLQYASLHGAWTMTAWMWGSGLLMIGALVVLYVPAWRQSHATLSLACVCVFLSLWMDKGLAFIVGGFEPSSLGSLAPYRPSLTEWVIAAGIWALGALMLTMFYKITAAIRTSA
jgi:molybdopterin-containing oxidoreductase family membrane subunit